MKNEKGIATNDAQKTNLNDLITMKTNPKGELISTDNNTPARNKFQLDLFAPERPAKVLEIIHCGDCHHSRPLDGYRFGLMPLCSDCRTERSLEILSNRIERRAKR